MIATVLGFLGAKKMLLVGLLAAGLGLLVLWYRGEAIQARAERDLARAQIAILGAAVETCNSSIDHAKRAADAAVAGTAALVKEARRLSAPARHTVERIEKIIREPAPEGADCSDAWDRIEAEAAK